jgi:ribosome modulation factor
MPHIKGAYDEGRDAYLAGRSIASCDYTKQSYLGREWLRGYALERNDAHDHVEGINRRVIHV